MIQKYEKGEADVTVNKALKLYDIFGHSVFDKVNIFETPFKEKLETKSAVGKKYSKLGFEAIDTKKVPFDVIAKIHAGSNQSLIIQEVKIQLENDTIIHQESLNFSISAGYTETYSTSLQISTEGEYVIYVLVDTSEGPLEAKFLVKVGIKDDTTDDKDTEPRIESTPGFEGIFILSALVLIPLLFKRRKR